MSSRQSLAPGSRRKTMSASLKTRQLSYLNAQVAQLQANIADMESHLKVTVAQADYIRKLGVLHGALLMGSHRVFEDEETAEFKNE